jgi:hypothetical protein
VYLCDLPSYVVKSSFIINSGRMVLGLLAALNLSGGTGLSQKAFPDPPADLTRVYYGNADNQVSPLPFEEGITPLNVFAPAEKDRVVRVQVKGPTSATALANQDLRFYVFVGDKMDPPPHQLVRLTSKNSDRELTISVLLGRRGYAPFEVDNIRIEHRLLERLRVSVDANRFLFVNYMLIRPIQPLAPGEYAIIGDSLADMATFRISQ